MERIAERSKLGWRATLFSYPADGAVISSLLAQGRTDDGGLRALPA
jgi:hypothetical protein